MSDELSKQFEEQVYKPTALQVRWRIWNTFPRSNEAEENEDLFQRIYAEVWVKFRIEHTPWLWDGYLLKNPHAQKTRCWISMTLTICNCRIKDDIDRRTTVRLIKAATRCSTQLSDVEEPIHENPSPVAQVVDRLYDAMDRLTDDERWLIQSKIDCAWGRRTIEEVLEAYGKRPNGGGRAKYYANLAKAIVTLARYLTEND